MKRPFTPIDGLVLAAFLALGVTGAVLADPGSLAMLASEASRRSPWPGMPTWLADLELPSKRVRSDFAVFLALASLGVGLVTFRRGLGRRRRGGFPAPGVAASAAAVTVLLVDLALNAMLVTRQGYWSMVPATFWLTEAWHSWEFFPSGKAVSVAGSILGLWSYLVLARAWKARDDWRDWLGRWLAWCWLAHTGSVALFMALWG